MFPSCVVGLRLGCAGCGFETPRQSSTASTVLLTAPCFLTRPGQSSAAPAVGTAPPAKPSAVAGVLTITASEITWAPSSSTATAAVPVALPIAAVTRVLKAKNDDPKLKLEVAERNAGTRLG